MGNPREEQYRAQHSGTQSGGAWEGAHPSTPPPTYGAIPHGPSGHHPFTSEKSVCTAYVLCVLLGWAGGHHWYLHRPLFGLLYLFTFGFFGFGWLIDLCRMSSLVRRANTNIQNPHVPVEKDLTDAYILWLFPGGFLGLHNFYLRRYGFGVLYLMTFGLFGFGWIFDAFQMKKLVKAANDKDDREIRLCNAYLLTICPITGCLGAQQYYMNRPGFGVLYTLTFGLLGVGWLVDLCRLPSLVKDAERKRLEGDDRRKRLDDAYVMWFPLGFLGLHHFYLERPCWGCLYFFTFGLFGIGWIVDAFRLPFLVRQFNSFVDESRSSAKGISNDAHNGNDSSNRYPGSYPQQPPTSFPPAYPTAGAPSYHSGPPPAMPPGGSAPGYPYAQYPPAAAPPNVYPPVGSPAGATGGVQPPPYEATQVAGEKPQGGEKPQAPAAPVPRDDRALQGVHEFV